MSNPGRLIGLLILVQTLPYLNVLPWDMNSRWWLHLPPLAVLCVPLLPRLWKTSQIPRGYWVYLAWSAVSLAWTPQPHVAIGRLIPIVLILAVLCTALGDSHKIPDIHQILDGVLKACALLVGLNTLAELLYPNAVSFSSDWGFFSWSASWESHQWVSSVVRFCGMLGEPNEVGSLMMVTVQAGLLHWRQCRWKKRLAVLMILAVVEGAMSDSRTPFVALAVGLICWGAWRFGATGKVAAFALLAVLVIAPRINSPYLNRGAADLNGRTWMWSWEVGKVAEKPFAGYGYGIEGLLMQDRLFPSWEEAFQDPHASLQNGYLSIAIESGVPALLLFLFVFLRPWRAALRGRSRFLKDALCVVIVPALVFAMSESGIAEPRDPAGILVFLIWLLAERYRILMKERQRVLDRANSGLRLRRRRHNSRWDRLLAAGA